MLCWSPLLRSQEPTANLWNVISISRGKEKRLSHSKGHGESNTSTNQFPGGRYRSRYILANQKIATFPATLITTAKSKRSVSWQLSCFLYFECANPRDFSKRLLLFIELSWFSPKVIILPIPDTFLHLFFFLPFSRSQPVLAMYSEYNWENTWDTDVKCHIQ